MLHLHRLDDDQRLPAPDTRPGLDHQLRHPPRHRCGEPPCGRVLAGARSERVDLGETPAFAFEEHSNLGPMIHHGNLLPYTIERHRQLGVGSALALGENCPVVKLE